MTRRGWLLFATMCVLWGMPYLLIKVAVEELSPPQLVLLRTGFAALLLLPWAAARGLAAQGRRPAVRREVGVVVVCPRLRPARGAGARAAELVLVGCVLATRSSPPAEATTDEEVLSEPVARP